jgi:hypothetical protein
VDAKKRELANILPDLEQRATNYATTLEASIKTFPSGCSSSDKDVDAKLERALDKAKANAAARRGPAAENPLDPAAVNRATEGFRRDVTELAREQSTAFVLGIARAAQDAAAGFASRAQGVQDCDTRRRLLREQAAEYRRAAGEIRSNEGAYRRGHGNDVDKALSLYSEGARVNDNYARQDCSVIMRLGR